jgi:hypothetical protein
MMRAKAGIVVATLAATCAATAPAFADGAACADVRIDVHGASRSPTPAKLIDAILAEISSRTSGACGSDDRQPVARITLDWDAGRRARLRVDLSDGDHDYVTSRDFDLSRIAPDAAPLALSIAADELLREARAQQAQDADAEAVPVTPPPPSTPERMPLDAGLLRPPHGGTFGSRFGLEWFSSSAVLAGWDAVLDRRFGPSLTLSLHVGLRAALEDWQANDRLALTTGGAHLRWTIAGDKRRAVGVAGGVDVFAIGTPAGDWRATIAPGAAGYGFYALADWCRVAVDVGAGVALLPLALSDGAVVHGGELRTSVALLVDF